MKIEMAREFVLKHKKNRNRRPQGDAVNRPLAEDGEYAV